MTSISLVLPSRNRSELLQHNLMSLRNQSFKDFEIIIVDNSGPNEVAKLKILKDNFKDLDIKA